MIRALPLSIAVGVITTVIVAWGLALVFDSAGSTMSGSVRWCSGKSAGAVAASEGDWWVWVIESRGTLMIQRAATYSSTPMADSACENLRIPAWSALWRSPLPHELALRGTSVEEARGWPCLCFLSQRHYGTNPSVGSTTLPFQRTQISVPLRPLWGGLAVNSAIFGAVWLVLLMTPGGIRKVVRRQRGACGDCGYDLRGAAHVQCPECGAMVRGLIHSAP